MTPEEIVQHLDDENRRILSARFIDKGGMYEQILHLMNTAALHGFRFGSESAFAIMEGTLLVSHFTKQSMEQGGASSRPHAASQ